MTPRFAAYLRAQLKRAAALLPPLLVAAALLLAATGLLGLAVGESRASDASTRKIRVGLAGDVESSALLRMGVYALEHFDAARYEIELIGLDEAEAARLLRAGALDAYLVVPDGFAEALEAGETRPVRYVTAGGAALGAALAEEAVRAVSDLLLETENAVYGAQRYLAEQAPDADPYAAGDRLVQEELALLLDRDALIETEVIGVGAGLGFADYYACALELLFLLLWGVAAAPVYARNGDAPRRMLYARGLGPARQILAEYLAYMALLLGAALCAGGVFLLLLRLLPGLAAALGLDGGAAGTYLLRALAPAFVLGAMQLLLCELGGGLPLQFFVAAAMAYVCGCFYPASFFPDGLRRFGEALPAGLGLRWLSSPDLTGAVCLATWLAAFLLLLTWRRARALKGGAA